jgi:hypothetical protein
MQVVDFILNAFFWGFVGSLSSLIWFKASYSCIELVGTIACTPHPFDLMRAFVQ